MLPSKVASSDVLSRLSTPVNKPVKVIELERARLIDENLPFLSSDLVALINEYDLALAAQPLLVNEWGHEIDCIENHEIKTAILQALLPQNAEPKIIRQIIINAVQYQYQAVLNGLISDLNTSGVRVKFDNVDLSRLNLKSLCFHKVSAIRLNLSHSILSYVTFDGADLTESILTETTFNNSFLLNSRLYGARMERTLFIGCAAAGLTTNDRDLRSIASMRQAELVLDGAHTTHQSNLTERELTLRLSVAYLARRCAIA